MATQGGKTGRSSRSYCREVYISICLDVWFTLSRSFGPERGRETGRQRETHREKQKEIEREAGVVTEGRHHFEYYYYILPSHTEGKEHHLIPIKAS